MAASVDKVVVETIIVSRDYNGESGQEQMVQDAAALQAELS